MNQLLTLEQARERLLSAMLQQEQAGMTSAPLRPDGDSDHWQEASRQLTDEGLAVPGSVTGTWNLTAAGRVAAIEHLIAALTDRKELPMHMLAEKVHRHGEAVAKLDAPAEPDLNGIGDAQITALNRLAVAPLYSGVSQSAWNLRGNRSSSNRVLRSLLERNLVEKVPVVGGSGWHWQLTALGRVAVAQLGCLQAQKLVDLYDEEISQARLLLTDAVAALRA